MDRHDLHDALGRGPRLPFPRATVSQAGHVFQELTHADDAAGVSIGKKLGDVARTADLAGLDQSRPVVSGIQQSLEQVGHRGPAHLVVQPGDDAGCPLGVRAVPIR